MKLFNFLLYIKKRLLIYLLICFFILTISFIYGSKYIISSYNNYNLSIFDLIIFPGGGGILNKKSMAMPIVIVFISLVIGIFRYGNETYVVLREKSRVDIWKNQSKRIAIVSFIYSIIVVLETYLISGIMLGDFTNRWVSKQSSLLYIYGNANIFDKLMPYLNTGFLLGMMLVALFLGLTGIGLLIEFLKIKFNTQYILLTIVIIILYEVIDMDCSIIVTKMAININNFLEPKVIIMNFTFLMLLSVISYICGRESIVRKDFFYNKK